jgi:hypothetical protein
MFTCEYVVEVQALNNIFKMSKVTFGNLIKENGLEEFEILSGESEQGRFSKGWDWYDYKHTALVRFTISWTHEKVESSEFAHLKHIRNMYYPTNIKVFSDLFAVKITKVIGFVMIESDDHCKCDKCHDSQPAGGFTKINNKFLCQNCHKNYVAEWNATPNSGFWDSPYHGD